MARGLAIIDGGHYGIEHITIEDMRQYLEKNLKDVEVIALDGSSRFCLCKDEKVCEPEAK